MKIYREVLVIRKIVLSTDHPATQVTCENLAGVYMDQGNYNAAVGLLRELLAVRKRLYGACSPVTLETTHAYMHALQYQGKRRATDDAKRSREPDGERAQSDALGENVAQLHATASSGICDVFFAPGLK